MYKDKLEANIETEKKVIEKEKVVLEDVTEDDLVGKKWKYKRHDSWGDPIELLSLITFSKLLVVDWWWRVLMLSWGW